MKIAFLIRSLARGGAERQLVLLANELKKLGHEVSVLVFYGGGALEQDLIQNNVSIISLNKRGRWDLLLFAARFIKAVRRLRPDIVYGFLTSANLMSLLARTVSPSTKIIFGIRSSTIDFKYYDWVARVTTYLEMKFSRFAQGIISNSQAGKTHAVNMGFSEHQISVIPNGIDPHRFYSDRALGTELRRSLNIADSDYLIGMVARIDPLKNYPGFLQAAALLAQKRSNVRFLCMGEGSQQDQAYLEKLAIELQIQNKITWLAGDAALEKVYNALDVFCLTSVSEGFSNVLGEAMASGVPCVATDVGDAKFILGSLGKIVGVNDPKQVSEACDALLEEKISRTAIREWICDHFSVKTMTEKSDQAMRALL